jgi:hypothetical protein
MGKFKVGDRVRSLSGDAEYVGIVGTIIMDDGSSLPYKVKLDKPVEKYDDTTIWRSSRDLELVEQPAAWQPKVGDRVRWKEAFASSFYTKGSVYEVRDDRNGSLFLTDDDRNAESGDHQWDSDGIREHFDLVPPFAIEAGKFYKTRDGRKVGPIRIDEHDDLYPLGARCEAEDRTLWYTAGGHYWTTELKSEHDLIAEWVDEPAVAASNDNAAPAKFKVGDRVKFRDDYGSSARGKEATVIAVNVWGDDGIQVNLGWVYGTSTERASDLRPIKTPPSTATAIVALIENGQPKPSDRPFVHADEGAACKEAARLADKHKGQSFGVYVLTQTVSVERTITYAHEWQRLAAKGDKIPAIKALRSLTGLGLKATKDAVEHWVANDEPYSRIAA